MIYCRLLDVSKFNIVKIINIYSIFGALNLMVMYSIPIMIHERRLPFFMYVPFGIDQTTIGYCFMYLYQFGNVVYAGGLNIAVNMYLFAMFVCMTFFLSLLSSRLSRLGYSKGSNEIWTKTPYLRQSYYREVCGLIELHLKIAK